MGGRGGKSQLAKSANNYLVLWKAVQDESDLITSFVRGAITERWDIFRLCCGLFKYPSRTNPISARSTSERVWLEMQLGINIWRAHSGPHAVEMKTERRSPAEARVHYYYEQMQNSMTATPGSFSTLTSETINMTVNVVLSQWQRVRIFVSLIKLLTFLNHTIIRYNPTLNWSH